MNLRKITSIIMALAMLMSAVLVLASCEEEKIPPPTNTDVETVIPRPPVTLPTEKLENGLEVAITSEDTCYILSVGDFKGDELTIPSSDSEGRAVTHIGDNAFKNQIGIKKVIIEDGLTEIGGGAFRGCAGIKEITLPESLEKIATFAFYGCSSLKEISIPQGVSYIGQSSFTECYGLESFNVSKHNHYYQSVDGVLYTSKGDTLVFYPIASTRSEYTVLDGTQTINNLAFAYSKYLVTVTFPSSLKNVADHAFRQSKSLTTVTLSESLERLGVGAFYECKELKTLNYPGTKETWDDEEQMELANTWDRGAGKYTINYNYGAE